jgi:hypothetical protein
MALGPALWVVAPAAGLIGGGFWRDLVLELSEEGGHFGFDAGGLGEVGA